MSDPRPTPYYEDELVTLYNGKAEDILPSLAGIGVDVVLTSPPYNLRGNGYDLHGNEFAVLDDGYATHADDLDHDVYVEWMHTVLRGCRATLNPGGGIFFNHKPLLSRLPGRALRLPFDLVPDELPLRQVITWDRGTGFVRTFAHYVPSYEWVLVLADEDFRITTRDIPDVWRITLETSTEHPAPFPLSLARKVMSTTSGNVVLDPFAGSGTTLRAATEVGRRAIGIELDPGYCELIVERLSQGALVFDEPAPMSS